MRCLALAQAWKKQGGHVTFISACEGEVLYNRIINEGFQLVSIEDSYPHPADLIITKKTIDNSSVKKSWIVLDGYHFDTHYQKSIKNDGNPVLIIDDTAHLNRYSVDIILNQNINAKELSYSCDPGTKFLMGTDYVLLRDEFLAYKDWKRGISAVTKNILVTMGGGDQDNETLKVLEALDQIDIDGLKIKVVVGPNNPYISILEKAVIDSKHSIELLKNVSNMAALMAKADLAVGAGGSTTWERCYLGLPAIVVCTAENQVNGTEILSKTGLVYYLGEQRNILSEDYTRAILHLIKDRSTYQKISQAGLDLVDSLGVERVVKAMERSFY